MLTLLHLTQYHKAKEHNILYSELTVVFCKCDLRIAMYTSFYPVTPLDRNIIIRQVYSPRFRCSLFGLEYEMKYEMLSQQ